MSKLKTHQEVKDYVIETINTGNRKRITAVLKRYQEYLKEESTYEKAKKIFGDNTS